MIDRQHPAFPPSIVLIAAPPNANILEYKRLVQLSRGWRRTLGAEVIPQAKGALSEAGE
jgi:hypothetical protein